MDQGARPGARRRWTPWLLLLGALGLLTVLACWLADGPDESAPGVASDPPAPSPPTVAETARRLRQVAKEPLPAPDASPSPADHDDEPKKKLRVKVVAADGGAPVEGALVRISGGRMDEATWREESTTAADGTAAFEPKERAERVRVRKSGFLLARAEVGERKEVVVELAAGISVRGRVVFADTRAPAAGTLVHAWFDQPRIASESVDLRQTTDADGRFELAGVPAGKPFHVWAARPGWRTADAVVTRTAVGGDDVELVLGDGGVLEGTVFDRAGKPMPGVSVYLIREEMDPPGADWAEEDTSLPTFELQGFVFPATPTDEHGRYQFKGVRLPIDGVPQPRLVAARDGAGRIAKSAPATFTRHGERMQRDVRFDAASSITVKLSRPLSHPDGVRVRAQRSGPMAGSDHTVDLAPGQTTVAFEDLVPGVYFVSVEAGERFGHFTAAHRAWMQQRTLEPAARLEVGFELGGTHRVLGTVVDEAGRPVKGVRLQLSTGSMDSDGRIELGAVSAEDGSFAFDGLPPTPAKIDCDRERFGPDPTLNVARVEDVVPDGPRLRLVARRRGTLTGRLVPTPKARESVHASVAGETAWTSAELTIADDGRFRMASPVVDAPLTAYFEFDGLAPVVIADVTVPAGGTLDVGDVAVEPGVAFAGRLVNATGAPIAGASLRVVDLWMEDLRLATDAYGAFRIERMPRRTVHVSVAATETTPNWILAFDPTASATTFTVGAGATVSGRVLDAAGEALPHVPVQFRPASAGKYESYHRRTIVSGDDGAFSFRLQPGRYGVSAGGHRDAQKFEPPEIVVLDGANAPIVLRLR